MKFHQILPWIEISFLQLSSPSSWKSQMNMKIGKRMQPTMIVSLWLAACYETSVSMVAFDMCSGNSTEHEFSLPLEILFCKLRIFGISSMKFDIQKFFEYQKVHSIAWRARKE